MESEKKKFIPYEKLSKKEQRKIDIIRRGSWQGVDPVTKVIPSEKLKAYNRKQKHKKDLRLLSDSE